MQFELNLDRKWDPRIFEGLAPHIVEAFWKYHALNPQVWELFERFALQLRDAGRKRYGASAIVQRIRWHMAVETQGDEFKINDHYSPCYARLLILKYPEFQAFFELRRSRQ